MCYGLVHCHEFDLRTDEAMPILGLLGAVLYFGCIIHAIKTGRTNPWLPIIMMLPGIGSVAYLLMEAIPAAHNTPTGRATIRAVVEKIDPDRMLREHADNLDAVQSADNKRFVAEECMKRGQWDDAIKLFLSALTGFHATDPTLLIGLARAYFGSQNFQRAIETLDSLRNANPDYQSREAHMIYARALEMLGRSNEAVMEYRALIGYALGPEAQVRYGLLMKACGEIGVANEAFRNAVNTYGRRRGKLAPADREWIAVAEQNLA